MRTIRPLDAEAIIEANKELELEIRRTLEHNPLLELDEEPVPGTSVRKRYLVLYDTVPGGTGYLGRGQTDAAGCGGNADIIAGFNLLFPDQATPCRQK